MRLRPENKKKLVVSNTYRQCCRCEATTGEDKLAAVGLN
jgi:hypothetical protein